MGISFKYKFGEIENLDRAIVGLGFSVFTYLRC